MNLAAHTISFYTLARKEIWRFLRIWSQTILPPAITMSLYFVIFGHLVGSQLHTIDGFTYMQYIAPGLMMMAMINNAYTNTVNSLYMARFQHSIDELLVAPMPNVLILLGYVSAAVLRALLVGILVALVALSFTHLTVQHWGIVLFTALLSATLFALVGFLNGMVARSWDDVGFVPTFVLTPLTYLGGVFYSLHILPPFWSKLSMFNPILYMVNTFRYGWLGVSDIPVWHALLVMMILVAVLFGWCWHWLNKGVGIRT